MPANADSQKMPDFIVGRGNSGPSNQRAIGPQMALTNLNDAVENAFLAAGIPRQTVDAVVLGLAGADRVSDRECVLEWAKSVKLAQRIEVVNDAVPLLYCGQGNGHGIALIAGTGSLAWGRDHQGRTARSGGWGYLMGDEGSAWWIGQQVLLAVVRAVDGRGPKTSLQETLLTQIEVSSPREIVPVIYSHETPRSLIAGLAPLAFSAAESGDAAAGAILTLAAGCLAEMVAAVSRQLNCSRIGSLALSGSVLIQQCRYRERVLEILSQHQVVPDHVEIISDAAVGSLRMACLTTNSE